MPYQLLLAFFGENLVPVGAQLYVCQLLNIPMVVHFKLNRNTVAIGL